jgi:hypothetical protein
MGILREDLCIFMLISRSVFLMTRNILHESCRGNQKHTIYINTCYFSDSSDVYEIMWENMLQLVLSMYHRALFNQANKKNTEISDFMNIRPVGAKLFHANRRKDGRTDGKQT